MLAPLRKTKKMAKGHIPTLMATNILARSKTANVMGKAFLSWPLLGIFMKVISKMADKTGKVLIPSPMETPILGR